MNKKIFNIKQKSIIFILLLISILLLTLYFQNKTSNRNYLTQIETNYQKWFGNYYISFQKHLIDFYEAQSIYIQNDDSNIELLMKKEKYLKNVELLDINDENNSSHFINKVLKGKAFIDVQDYKKDVFYKVVVPILDKTNIKSYVVYTVDSRLLLEGIKEFNGSNGIIYKEDNNHNDIYLKHYLNDTLYKEMAAKCRETTLQPVFKSNSNFYVKKNVILENHLGDGVANAVVFLDVTKAKLDYIYVVRKSIATTVLLFIIASIIVYYFFNYLIRRIEKNENELKKINKNLEYLVEKETNHRLKVEKTALEEKQKNEQLLIQQSKLALLGEMIGNIAHQWRQPLMQLSAILMYLDAYNEKGKLTSDKLILKVKDGNCIIDFMSKTIEDFRNYYKPEKQKEKFFIKDTIDSALFIVNSALKNANIKVHTLYCNEDIVVNSFKNEFSQALLNIITNAKDILIQRKIENPIININVLKEKDSIIISLSDNAGGIDEDIINNVFDPYFTTKHKSQGTGIGLYMSKMIIENNMSGKICVENASLGAKFIINLKV